MIGFVSVVMAAGQAANAPALAMKRDTAMALAQCIEQRAPERVAVLLTTEPSGDQERRQTIALASASSSCYNRQASVSFSIGLLRGQFAELAFRATPALLETAGALGAGVSSPPNLAEIDKLAEKQRDSSRELYVAELFRRAYAACVAALSPKAVAAMVSTGNGSASERAAFLTAGPAIMNCMPKGVSYSLKVPELRPYLVAALHYRIVRDVRTGA